MLTSRPLLSCTSTKQRVFVWIFRFLGVLSITYSITNICGQRGGGFSVLCGIKVKRFLRHLYMSACVLRDNAYRMGTDPWHYELLRRLDDERKSCRTC